MRQNRCAPRPRAAGFTLVELLVALALFALLMAVMSSTLVGILGVNRGSQQRLASTSEVQQVMESIKASWSSEANYGNICAELDGGALPAGMTAKVQGLDKRGGSAGQAADVVLRAPGACPTTVPSGLPDMRRVTVTSTDAEEKTVTIVLDIVNPQRLR